ncbi:hypothetical protein ACGFZ9_44900 [Streptomyces mirabilis]|uniref:hypothetical protein n=1 Tax=Streptomyces mirabilis TaxID=68239 RepID=UPI00370F7914
MSTSFADIAEASRAGLSAVNDLVRLRAAFVRAGRGEGVFLLVQRRQVDGVARLEKEIVVLRRRWRVCRVLCGLVRIETRGGETEGPCRLLEAGRVRAQRPLVPAGLVRVGWPVLGVGAQARSDLVGELDHQPLAGDEVGRGRAGVLGLEQAGGGLAEGGVQGAEALQVAAGAVAFDTADVFSGPGI